MYRKKIHIEYKFIYYRISYNQKQPESLSGNDRQNLSRLIENRGETVHQGSSTGKKVRQTGERCTMMAYHFIVWRISTGNKIG